MELFLEEVGMQTIASRTFIPGFGWIELVDVYEKFLSYYPLCELQSKNWVVKNMKPDWYVIDVGANIGYYSILFSKIAKSGFVSCYEPTSTFEKLSANLNFYKCSNVIKNNFALGSEVGYFN